jgi:outer membrane protein assembly factor BamB
LRRFVARLRNETTVDPENRVLKMGEVQIVEKRRLPSPAPTPQALAWDGKRKVLWMGSRDWRRIYAIDPESWAVLEEREAPGIPWAAVVVDGEVRFTIGEGADDDRYIYRHTGEAGFSKMFACPEFTGSYLSFDGRNLYLSQWYKHRILKFDANGNVTGQIDVGAEICGHTFADGWIYVLLGQEQPNESWRIARLDPQEETPEVEDIAVVPFACRSLTFDGELFWSNYRAKDTIVSFVLPSG